VAQTAQNFGTGLTESVTGLTQGSTYTFVVNATNANGAGLQSVASSGYSSPTSVLSG